jgi:hypothetical protein
MSSRCLSFSSFHQAREELSSHDEIAEQYRKMLLVRDSGSETEVDRGDEGDEPLEAPIDDYDEVKDEFELTEEQEAGQHGAPVHMLEEAEEVGCELTAEEKEADQEEEQEEPVEEKQEEPVEESPPPATSSKAAGMPPSGGAPRPTACVLNRGPPNLRL